MNYNYLDEHNKTYRDHKDLVGKVNSILDKFEANRDDFDRLVDYYYSEDFRKDLDMSNKGEIPENVDQSLLTEDAIYDLMGDDYYLALRLLDLANKMIQQK